jgi:hypothetical protein
VFSISTSGLEKMLFIGKDGKKKKKMGEKKKTNGSYNVTLIEGLPSYPAMSNEIRTTILFIVLACMAVKKFSSP